jgi:CDP-diacylglycerol--serine O-phosphatidyltransferase
MASLLLHGNCEGASVKHLSMIRGFTAADFLTLGNAACGVASVFCAIAYASQPGMAYFYTAALLAPAAFAFDVLDGRVRAFTAHQFTVRARARLAGGRHLLRRGSSGARVRGGTARRLRLDALIYFVCCGVSRLARYNVTAEAMAPRLAK